MKTRNLLWMVILLLTTLTFSACGSNADRNTADQETQNANEYLTLAEDCLAEEDFEQALEYFEKYIALNPGKPRGYLGLSETYIAMGKMDLAVLALQNGLSATEGNTRIQSALDALPADAAPYTLAPLESSAIPASTPDPASLISVSLQLAYPNTATTAEVEKTIQVLEQRFAAWEVHNYTISENGDNRLLVMYAWSVDSGVDTGVFAGLLATRGAFEIQNSESGAIIARNADVVKTDYGVDKTGSHIVRVTLSGSGKNAFETETSNLAKTGGRFSARIDGELISSPIVTAPVTDGVCIISGAFSEASARSIANLISAGALPFALETLESQYNDPTAPGAVPKATNAITPVPHPRATIEMEDGSKMVIELYPEAAPNTVYNFISLAQKGFYNGLTFHRIADGAMYGGDPTGTGVGGPGYAIRGEFANNGAANSLLHTAGVLSMVLPHNAPDSAGSQFFICTEDATRFDGKHAAFGKIVDGMDTMRTIQSTATDTSNRPIAPQRIKSITVDTLGMAYPEPDIIPIAVSEYILPFSSTRRLTASELEPLTKDELRLARNEIFARYGRQFNDPSLQSYFATKVWYVALPKLPVGTDPTLTELELANIDLIKEYEAK